ncbi:hypothetical protein Tco_0515406 [Tanacetum coccineum]
MANNVQGVQPCLTTRTAGHDQTKINILQLFYAVISRTNVDYAALLWSTPRAYRTPTLTASPQGMKRKQIEENKDDDDFKDRLEPGSHKDKPKYVNDDDDRDDKKVDEEVGSEMGS